VELAGLDELTQACLDRRADAPQLPDPAGTHELRDVDGRLTHNVRGAAVGAHAVAVRAGQLEQRRERLELGCVLRVDRIASRRHADSLPAVASVVVPFRAASAKRRLEPLDEEARGQLAHRMLASVLEAAIAVGPTILVTETDAECARALAAEHGISVVDDPGRGQGAAVAAALELVPDWPVLVVNADLPEARPRDLLALLGAMPEDGIAIAPAPDGTTNALALSRSGLFAPLYGRGSAARFLAHAEEAGVEAMELDIPGLARDVDTVDELARLAR
jgi:2-phospho-L-lactate/phosphoenolpyruvate guanylyltransferase